jgi:protein phosphatase PTC7
MKDEL